MAMVPLHVTMLVFFTVISLSSCGDSGSDSRANNDGNENETTDLFDRDSQSFNILTYNIAPCCNKHHDGKPSYDLANPKPMVDLIMNLVVQNNVDVIALQEALGYKDNDKKPDSFRFEDDLVEAYRKKFGIKLNTYYTKMGHYGSDTSKVTLGMVILSKHPMTAKMEKKLVDGRWVQAVKIKLPSGEQVTVTNVHPDYVSENNIKQHEWMHENFHKQFAGEPNHFIVGDFNMNEHTQQYKTYANGENKNGIRYVDSCMSPVADGTCRVTVSEGKYRVDYIFYKESSKISIKNIFVPNVNTASNGAFRPMSDHLPLIGHFRIGGEGSSSNPNTGRRLEVQQVFGSGKYWTLDMEAQYKPINPGGYDGASQLSNSFYANGPCKNTKDKCRIDDIAIGTLKQGNQNVQVQQIIANGRYWTLNVDAKYQPINPGGLEGYPLLSNSFYAQGPCKRQKGACQIDGLAIGRIRRGNDEVNVQQVIAAGRYWTLDIDNLYAPINPGGLDGTPLVSNSIYKDGPCRGHEKDCHFQSLALGEVISGNRRVNVQQVVAYGKYWTLDINDGYKAINPGGLNGTSMNSNSFFDQGPCKSKGANCEIDGMAIGSLNQK